MQGAGYRGAGYGVQDTGCKNDVMEEAGGEIKAAVTSWKLMTSLASGSPYSKRNRHNSPFKQQTLYRKVEGKGGGG